MIRNHRHCLSWLKTYLSSHSFYVLACDFTTPLYPLSCGIPQGSLLGPFLFNMYTTPLSTFISSQSLNNHIYAADHKIFISYAPKTFITAVSQLQVTIYDISS